MQFSVMCSARGALLLLSARASVAFAAPQPVGPQLPLVATDSNPLKVPGYNNAYHCSDPANDLYQIDDMSFDPMHPRVGYYMYIKLRGNFREETGQQPWLNITGTVDGKETQEPMWDTSLCDAEVWQELPMPVPDNHDIIEPYLHRACPPGIKPGYTLIESMAMPLYPGFHLDGKYDVHAEATTDDGRRIFCVEGTVVVQEEWRRRPDMNELR